MSATRIATLGTAAVLGMLLTACAGASVAGSRGCTYVASPAGSDRAPGSVSRPFRTVQRLSARLRAGQTGCIRAGTYRESLTIAHGGASEANRVTIESYPGERATLVGRLYLRNSAPYVTIANMNLNGRNSASLPSPDIAAAGDRFIGNDVSNEHTEICFILGAYRYGRAKNTLIQGNRIHDCGLEPSRNGDHGIYVAFADNTRILENVIFDNTDRGVQIYPDAQKTVVEHNIIDRNGEGVAIGGERTTSNNSTVAFNLITNSVLGYDVASFFPRGTPVGVNNVFRDNCIFGGRRGTIARETGFSAANLGNAAVNPGYASPATGNYSVPHGNRCAAYVPAGTPVKPF